MKSAFFPKPLVFLPGLRNSLGSCQGPTQAWGWVLLFLFIIMKPNGHALCLRSAQSDLGFSFPSSPFQPSYDQPGVLSPIPGSHYFQINASYSPEPDFSTVTRGPPAFSPCLVRNTVHCMLLRFTFQYARLIFCPQLPAPCR